MISTETSYYEISGNFLGKDISPEQINKSYIFQPK